MFYTLVFYYELVSLKSSVFMGQHRKDLNTYSGSALFIALPIFPLIFIQAFSKRQVHIYLSLSPFIGCEKIGNSSQHRMQSSIKMGSLARSRFTFMECIPQLLGSVRIMLRISRGLSAIKHRNTPKYCNAQSVLIWKYPEQ